MKWHIVGMKWHAVLGRQDRVARHFGNFLNSGEKGEMAYYVYVLCLEVYQVELGMVVCVGSTVNCSHVHSSDANVYSSSCMRAVHSTVYSTH